MSVCLENSEELVHPRHLSHGCQKPAIYYGVHGGVEEAGARHINPREEGTITAGQGENDGADAGLLAGVTCWESAGRSLERLREEDESVNDCGSEQEGPPCPTPRSGVHREEGRGGGLGVGAWGCGFAGRRRCRQGRVGGSIGQVNLSTARESALQDSALRDERGGIIASNN